MKIIKIGAMWCSGCLIMNNVFNKFIKEYNVDYLELDIDLDEEEVSKYNISDKIPVFIIFDGECEIARFSGEYKYQEFISKLKGVGLID